MTKKTSVRNGKTKTKKKAYNRNGGTNMKKKIVMIIGALVCAVGLFYFILMLTR